MKNMKNMKKVAVLILSVCLIMVFANSVFAADDDDLFKAVTATNNTSNSTTDNSTTNTNTNTNSNTSTNNTVNNTNTSLSSNTNTNSNNSNTNNTIRNTSANTNSNKNTTNTLAKTGLSNTGSIIALVVVVCGVSAIYSYKKVNDYKKI